MKRFKRFALKLGHRSGKHESWWYQGYIRCGFLKNNTEKSALVRSNLQSRPFPVVLHPCIKEFQPYLSFDSLFFIILSTFRWTAQEMKHLQANLQAWRSLGGGFIFPKLITQGTISFCLLSSYAMHCSLLSEMPLMVCLPFFFLLSKIYSLFKEGGGEELHRFCLFPNFLRIFS